MLRNRLVLDMLCDKNEGGRCRLGVAGAFLPCLYLVETHL